MLKRNLFFALIALQFIAGHSIADETTPPTDLPPEYYDAAARMRNGILLTSIVGVPGVLHAIGGLLVGRRDVLRNGLALGGIGIGVGVSMIVSGAKQKKRIKRRWLLDKKASGDEELRFGISLVEHDPVLAVELRF